MNQSNPPFEVYVDMSNRMSASIVAGLECNQLYKSLGVNDDTKSKKKIQYYIKQVEEHILNDLKVS